MTPARETVDLAIVGASASGLAAAIAAGEAARDGGAKIRIVLLDGARRAGAKILASGGGRCNVTHERVTPKDYNGGSRNTIRKVLKAFDERRTVEWFAGLGVELKTEPGGKLFPVSDRARTVLEALERRAKELGCETMAQTRVREMSWSEADGLWRIERAGGPAVLARRAILATGGRALPKSGSDGWGLQWLGRRGHTVVPVTPALAPLVLRADKSPAGRFSELMGLTIEARLEVRAGSGTKIASETGPVLFTHFGISGPAPMDMSRHWLRAQMEKLDPVLTLGHPALPDFEAAEKWLLERAGARPGERIAKALGELWPQRWAEAMADGLTALGALRREERRDLAKTLVALALPVAGSRGWTFAETTAGGVALGEIDARTMASRVLPSLHLCGEVLDVDGRIGGFNFQWAWASGRLAGRGAVSRLRS